MKKNKPKLLLDFCSHKAAKYACKNWHYSKTLPPPPHNFIGVWEDRIFKGVIVYARGASASLFKPYGLKQNEGCELVRVALTHHYHNVSKMLAISFKLLKKRNPLLKLVISFADPYQKHHGGIYQASNWVYLGDSGPSKKYIAPNGKELHSRQVSEKGYNIQYGKKRKTYRPSECKQIILPGKHRYAIHLCDEMRVYLDTNKKKYPRRTEHESNASTFHVEESGAIPTSALQSITHNNNCNKV